jgi:hypothetical protein
MAPTRSNHKAIKSKQIMYNVIVDRIDSWFPNVIFYDKCCNKQVPLIFR